MKKAFCIILCMFFLTGCTIFKKELSLEDAENVSSSYSAISNKAYGWGLKKNVKAPPDIPNSIVEMLSKYDAYYIDSVPKTLYLTFDEGYENGYTSQILDTLRENDVKAAFFITGPYLEKETELVRRMVDEGHVVGNHTVNHPSMPEVTDNEKLKKEINDLNQRFYEKFGKNMKYIRPPKGEYSERTLAISKDLGYMTVLWSFAYKDWDVKNQKGVSYAYKEIINGVHDGCILLLHAVSKDNAEVLDRVIKDLKKEGYIFRCLDEFGMQ